MRDKNNEPQWPNLMVSRHGASANQLQKCAECRHLIRVEGYPEYCDQFVLPSGYHMPWGEGNRACGLFQERGKEEP
jgi:hypothetical protein